VAGEVRNLAQRSATAAKDIKNLIDVSVGKVSAGMAQVDRAGATMKEVVASVQQVTAIMHEISVASHEQSIGVDQVNSAIAHMDQVTQQNAALVEEAAAATASLATEAGGLTQAVSLFKFGPVRTTRPCRAKHGRQPTTDEAPRRLRSCSNAAFPEVEFDAAIIGKLSQSGPRYTSYPTADRFHNDFGYGQLLEAVAGLRMRRSRRPLSLYIHIPFCDTICYYCGCNKIVTKDHSKAATYLGYLKQEIDMQGRLFDGMGQIEQLHFGGGTPTYLSDRQMGDLMAHLRANFDFASDQLGEYSIEIDPRTVSVERVHNLRAQGFNRISLGVQDFDADVQKAVNRIQPEAETRAVMDAARDAGFRSISIDLIYGLPKQSMASMEQTLDKVIAASPDRIALYNYAHMPHLFKPQRRIADADLPTPAVKLDLLALCIRSLCAAGYVYIGMDHFAKPDDELAVAQRQGRCSAISRAIPRAPSRS
jgi:coproporphyrinogen III oxidase-like Fe-S oxidoreductase